MQNYLELQNKLRRELSERWNQYYQVDGLSKQKGNNIKFTPTTALQGIMFQVTKELQDLEDVLTQKNPGESPAQQLARQKMLVNEKIPKLMEQHKQASTSGILGKDEAWAKLLKKYPELDAFVKKHGKVRANEAILNSMSPNINDYETNLAKANLAKEYESAEFKQIAEFLARQKQEIERRKEQEEQDDRLENAMNAYAIMENRNATKRNVIKDRERYEDAVENRRLMIEDDRIKRGFDELPLVLYDENQDEDDDEEDNDDVETVAQREKRPKINRPKPKKTRQELNKYEKELERQRSEGVKINPEWTAKKERELQKQVDEAFRIKMQGEIDELQRGLEQATKYSVSGRDKTKRAHAAKNDIYYAIAMKEANIEAGYERYKTLDEYKKEFAATKKLLYANPGLSLDDLQNAVDKELQNNNGNDDDDDNTPAPRTTKPRGKNRNSQNNNVTSLDELVDLIDDNNATVRNKQRKKAEREVTNILSDVITAAMEQAAEQSEIDKRVAKLNAEIQAVQDADAKQAAAKKKYVPKTKAENDAKNKLGFGKKPPPMKHKPKGTVEDYLHVDTQRPRHVTFPQLPPGVQNN